MLVLLDMQCGLTSSGSVVPLFYLATTSYCSYYVKVKNKFELLYVTLMQVKCIDRFSTSFE